MGLRPARRCATSRSTPSSSARAPTAASRTCASRPRSSRAAQVADGTRLLVVPGSVRVRLQAEDEGLDVVFKEAGAEWRGAGCSMCLGMNPDQLAPGERSASTSNRNFEGRQGKGGRTHLVSPPVAAATAVRGTLSLRPPTCADRRERTEPWTSSPPTPASASRCAAATSTPTRSSRRSTSSGSPAPASRTACSRPGATTRLRAQQPDVRRRRRSWSPAPTSAPARRASTPSGPCRTTASRPSSPRASPTSSAATPARPACSRRRSTRRSSQRLWDCLEADPGDRGHRRPRGAHGPCRRGDDAVEDSFDIDDYTRWRLLEGLDDIGITLGHEDRHRRLTRRARPAGSPPRSDEP